MQRKLVLDQGSGREVGRKECVKRFFLIRLFPEIFPELEHIIVYRGSQEIFPAPPPHTHTSAHTTLTPPPPPLPISQLLMTDKTGHVLEGRSQGPSSLWCLPAWSLLGGLKLPRSRSCRVRKFPNFWGWDMVSFIAKHRANTLSQLVTRLSVVQRACVLSSLRRGGTAREATKGNTQPASLPPSSTSHREGFGASCARFRCSLCGLS